MNLSQIGALLLTQNIFSNVMVAKLTRQEKTRKGLVQLEVLSQGRRKWIGTGIKVYADQWDDRKKVINAMDMLELNQCLDNLKAVVQNWVNELVANKEPFEFEKLEEFVKEEDNRVPDIIDKSYQSHGSIEISIPYFEAGKFNSSRGATIYHISYHAALRVLKNHVKQLKKEVKERNRKLLNNKGK